MRIHRLHCEECDVTYEKFSRNNDPKAVAKGYKCPSCSGDTKAIILAPSTHCFTGPYFDSHLQKPFATKTAMTESIKRRGLMVAND